MRKNWLKNIFSSELIRNSSILVSGNAVGQAVALLVYPILSRIYSDADFGVFALFSSVVGILCILSTGKYEEAFVLTKDKKESTALLGFLFRLLFGFCAILFLFLFFFRSASFSLLNMESLTDYWYMIPLTIFATGIFATLGGVSNKEKRYKIIASSNVTFNLLSSALRIGLRYITPNAMGLISGQLIAQVLSCFSFYKLKSNIQNAILKVKWREMLECAKRFIAFPKYNLPQNFINYFSTNLPFFFLAGIFGEAKLGLFFLAFNVSFRPINLLSASMYQVLFEKATSLTYEKQKISFLFNVYWKNNFLFILPFFILAFLLAPLLFKFIFGTEWEESGNYFRYILPWMFIVLCTSPMGFLPLLFNKQKIAMWFEVAYFLIRCLGLYIGIYLNSFNLAILLFSAVGFIFLVVKLIWFKYLIKQYDTGLY